MKKGMSVCGRWGERLILNATEFSIEQGELIINTSLIKIDGAFLDKQGDFCCNILLNFTYV